VASANAKAQTLPWAGVDNAIFYKISNVHVKRCVGEVNDVSLIQMKEKYNAVSVVAAGVDGYRDSVGLCDGELHPYHTQCAGHVWQHALRRQRFHSRAFAVRWGWLQFYILYLGFV
jgi:hypothetical protein